MSEIMPTENRASGTTGGNGSDGVLIASNFHADKTEYFRGLFEHIYRQPSAVRPIPPNANALIRLGAAIGGLFSMSGGEHLLLVITGQLNPDVTLRELQSSSVALESTGIDVSQYREQWNRDQKSAFLRVAAIVGEDLTDGRIDTEMARAAIQYLIEEIGRLNTSSGSPAQTHLA